MPKQPAPENYYRDYEPLHYDRMAKEHDQQERRKVSFALTVEPNAFETKNSTLKKESEKQKVRESSLSEGKIGKPPRPSDTFDSDKKTAKIETFLKPSLPN